MPLIGSICLILKLDGGAVAEGTIVDVADRMEVASPAGEEEKLVGIVDEKKTLSPQ